MVERSILFSAPMVLALLAHQKTVTRRLLLHDGAADVEVTEPDWEQTCDVGTWIGCDDEGTTIFARHRFGVPGDVLRVKEHAWMWCERQPNGRTEKGRAKWLYVPLRDAPIHYCADHPKRPQGTVAHPETGNEWGWRKKLGRFLPAWASRIRLEVVSVTPDRGPLTMEEACREGFDSPEAFAQLYAEINELPVEQALERWRWRVEFKLMEVHRGQ